jgi:hypothetical protein
VRDRYLFRHRAFEAAMDLRVFSEHGRGIEPKLGRILQRAAGRADAEELLAALARFYATEAPAPSIPDITTILRKAGGTQRLFFSTPVRLLARALHLRMAGKNADASALFYTKSSRWLRDFVSPRPFRDPISGVGGTFETNRFLDEAAQLSVANFARLERALDGDAQAFPHPGPSLESGHPLDADQRMRHCDPELLRS